MSELPEPGSRVRLTLEDEEVEGVLIPSDDEKFIVVKLESGYNIGVKKSRIDDVKVLEEKGKKEKSKKKKEQKVDEDKPTITILHTGGTIASKVDYETGAVVSQYDPEEILEMFPELEEAANIKSRLIGNISSEMMRFQHYNLMAEEVEKEVDEGVDGVVITHGTDTMHYSGAALSFILKGLDIPVLLVGSQRSSDRPSTDAYVNLMSAVHFINDTDFAGVAICMHENTSDDSCLIIHGCRARKMHTTRRDAFRPINSPPIARVDVEDEEIDLLGGYQKTVDDEGLDLMLFDPDVKVGIQKVHTNMFGDELSSYEGYDGLVLETFALGHAPTMEQDEHMTEHGVIDKAIADLCEEMPVAVASQCLYGRTDMDVYTPGRELKEHGVLGNNLDMTPETAYIKLAWLLSNYDSRDEIEKLYSENLRGEIAERTEKDTYLI